MAAPTKPRWLRLDDFLLPGSLPLISLALTIWLFNADDLTTSDGSPLPMGVFGFHGLMVTLTLVFLGIYLRLVWNRYKALKPFRYVKGNNCAFMVHPGEYKGSFETEILRLANLTFDGWSRVFGEVKIKDFKDDALFWVWFEPHPIENVQVRGQTIKAAGVTIGGSRKMRVAYKDPFQELDQTALRHEIGHVIQGHITGSWDNDEHHERSNKHNLR